MSTRSNIVLVKEDGSAQSIYCHWDGYPEYTGAVLLQHYTDPVKIQELINLGDISSIGPELGEKHDFNIPMARVVTAYHRDRGENMSRVKAGTYPTLKDALKKCNNDYTYVFDVKAGTWSYRSGRGVLRELTKFVCRIKS
jgi:hypothetical protein